jgi:hypothetical protein
MPIDQNMFFALLSLDSYSRGYRPGLDGMASNGRNF